MGSRALYRSIVVSLREVTDAELKANPVRLEATTKPVSDCAHLRQPCPLLAHSADKFQSSNAKTATPEGKFVCDRIYCEVGVQLCQRPTITQCDYSTSTSASCITVPDECLADPTCDCLDQITHETYDVVLGACSYFGGWGLLSSHTCQGTDGALEEACAYSNAYCFG